MAVYASIDDAVLIYGQTAVDLHCDRDLDGVVDNSSLNEHLAIASREMDGYLLGRYPLPLATPPEHFKKVCVDIAFYNAAATADVRTDEDRKRYDDAIGYMRLIAENRVKLETAANTTQPNQSASPIISTRPMHYACGVREFTFANLRRLV